MSKSTYASLLMVIYLKTLFKVEILFNIHIYIFSLIKNKLVFFNKRQNLENIREYDKFINPSRLTKIFYHIQFYQIKKCYMFYNLLKYHK